LNVGIHHQIRIAKIPVAVCVAVWGLALTGCSAAPAGAAYDSLAIGPVRTGANAQNFPPFPVPAKWTGADGADYTMVIKAKTGTKKRKFSVVPTSSLVFWLGCIGKGTARIVSPKISLNWSVPCGSGTNPAGITFTPPSAAVGTKVKVEVTSPPDTRWVFRADAKGVPHKRHNKSPR
jgi:hypothetical protein